MKNICKILKVWSGVILILIIGLTTSCNQATNSTAKTAGITYTCPMPEDSVFSDKPGRCPKCGMELIPVSNAHGEHAGDAHQLGQELSGYTCPMHPQVHSEKPGVCPICGMNLERVKTDDEPLSVSLDMLLKPANSAVVANVPMVHMAQREENLELEVLGNVELNPSFSGSISAKVSGRITRMFIKYRYQSVRAGQPLMEVYSQEMVAAQNNYLFLLKNDPSNQSLLEAARQKLLLLGMSPKEAGEVERSGRAKYAITVYSNANGVIDENADPVAQTGVVGGMGIPLSLKEGAYVEKGTQIFKVLNPSKARIALQLFPQHQEMLKPGDKVRIRPEANPDEDFRASILELVPYYQQQSKTVIARIPFDNSIKKLPIGSTVRAIVFTGYKNAWWLPEEAVTSLGLDKVVFVREQDGFIARKIKTGLVNKHLVQVLDGLKPTEAVAANAGFLVDSESFIMTKNN